MSDSMRMAKLDFYTMKSQLAAYLPLVAIISMFGFMDSPVTVLCITGAWFAALMSTNIFSIQEKNNLDRFYGSVSVKLNDIVLGRYVFVFLNFFISFLAVIALYFGFAVSQGKSMEFSDYYTWIQSIAFGLFRHYGNANAVVLQNGLHKSKGLVYGAIYSGDGAGGYPIVCVCVVRSYCVYAIK